jgi:Na+/melibiose symporter-like transporter
MAEAPALPPIHSESSPRGPHAAGAASGAPEKFYCEGWLVNLGWLNTTLALSMASLPIRYVLTDQLHLQADELARFMLLANLPIYVKPFAGILSDALPLFGTRRRHYLVFGLLGAALFWLLLGLVPRTFGSLLATYLLLNVFLTVVSTVLGGLMVEVGKRENKTGRLSSQRLGITNLMGMIGSPLGGALTRVPFTLPVGLSAFFYAVTAPVMWIKLREPGGQKADAGPLREVARQGRAILRSRTLWSAAGLIILVVAAPGFGTPLFYYQKETLKFAPEFIGALGVVGAGGAVTAAWVYSHFCRRLNLRVLLGVSIVLHAMLTLLYLLYRSPVSALLITAIEGATMSLALLPLYDLAARATPRGSEALGYCVILSVWNFTTMFSDYVGSVLYRQWQLTFSHLVWLNSGSTLLVLLAVPFLPHALMNRREGEPEAQRSGAR